MAILREDGRRCRAPSCPKVALRGTTWCTTHGWRVARFGGPEGRTLRQAELRPYRDRVANAIDLHSERADTKAALAWLALFLSPGSSQAVVRKHTDHLATGGIAARDLLITLGAVWWYFADRKMPDGAELSMAMGRAAIYAAHMTGIKQRRSGKPGHRHVPRRALLQTGVLLRASLAIYYKRLHDEMLAHEERIADLQRAIQVGHLASPPREVR